MRCVLACLLATWRCEGRGVESTTWAGDQGRGRSPGRGRSRSRSGGSRGRGRRRERIRRSSKASYRLSLAGGGVEQQVPPPRCGNLQDSKNLQTKTRCCCACSNSIPTFFWGAPHGAPQCKCISKAQCRILVAPLHPMGWTTTRLRVALAFTSQLETVGSVFLSTVHLLRQRLLMAQESSCLETGRTCFGDVPTKYPPLDSDLQTSHRGAFLQRGGESRCWELSEAYLDRGCCGSESKVAPPS